MTDNSNANTLGDLGRLLMQLLNYGVYFLLAIMYQIFFNVASAQLFESETIKNFYGRIQLIIGVFMVFKLAVTILQGIMNPDQFMNPKEGFGNFITRVIVALALLTVLVPINVPDVQNANSFEKYLNNNGLLFGTLYSLQDRILSNNTLGRLILGTTDNATGVDESNDAANGTQKDKLAQSSRIFSSTILKAFLRINLKPTEAREDDDETKRENWYCNETLDDQGEAAINTYTQLDVDPTTLLSWEFLTADCELNDSWLSSLGNSVSWIPIVGLFTSNTRYVFAFNWLAACIVGIIFLIIMIGFTIDIAIRSIKLAILRLIAPIPVISYIEPKSSKDGGMFSSWVKALTSTYLDLFLRLAIVYFVLFIIQDMIINGVIIDEAGGMVGIISFIFIMLGLFFFAKMAPKFIKDALGIKGSSMTNIGLTGLLAGAGAIRQGGTIPEAVEAMNDATRAQTMAYAHGKPMPELSESWNAGRDHVAKILTGDQNMSGRRMSRGARHLSRMGITTPYAEELKKKMYAAQDEAELAKNAAERGWDHMSASERANAEAAYRRNKNLSATATLTADQVDEMQKQGATMYANEMSAAAGKVKSDYGKIEGMQKQYGQARSYEAQFEGEDGRYTARNFTNRALGGLGRNHKASAVQQWRTQKYPNANPTPATNPRDSGMDFNPTGGMGEGPGDGGPGGPPPGP